MTYPTMTITVPARFWEDHLDRGCRCAETCPDKAVHINEDPDGRFSYGEKVRDGYRVELTDLDMSELLSDARHYSSVTQWGDPVEHFGLQSSARATVNRIEKARRTVRQEEVWYG